MNLIIGIGSTLRRDDGLGPDLAQHAAGLLPGGASSGYRSSLPVGRPFRSPVHPPLP